MNAIDQLRFSIRDLIDGVEVGPSRVPLALLGEFQKDVSEFLRGASRDVDPSQVQVSIESGSLAFTATGLLAAATLWGDLDQMAFPNALDLIDPRRASVLKRWQAAARDNPLRSYYVADKSGKVFLKVDSRTKLTKVDDVWVQVEKYLHGEIVDMGGKTKANVHLEMENGQSLTVASTHHLLAQDERNRLYRPALLHVTAEENLQTGEMRNLHLLSFETHHPGYDEDEFKRMVERGTRAWREVSNAIEWIEELRGGQA